jgi:hypothetical protein
MLIESNESFSDDEGEGLFEGMMYFDWKEWLDTNSKSIAKELDKFGIDLVEYETGEDFYALRFVKRKTDD